MYHFLHHLQSKGYRNRRVGIIENGSWAPVAGKTMKAMLEEMKEVEVVAPTVTLRGSLKKADVPALEALADAILA
jgi:flavorubredoxin